MTCDEARARLLDAQRGRLPADRRALLDAHVAGCEACAHEEAAETLLSELLEHRLPQHAAPLALKRRLAATWPDAAAPAPPWWAGWRRALVPALALGVLLLAALPLYYPQSGGAGAVMVTEAVNDHLRLLASHLDFAPVVRFLGDDDFPLRGGAVGYYVDRKAAVFVFYRRLHPMTLLVFRADGLPWAGRGLEPIGSVQAQVATSRGFNAILWREGELGYALVSDTDLPDLVKLVGKLAPTS